MQESVIVPRSIPVMWIKLTGVNDSPLLLRPSILIYCLSEVGDLWLALLIRSCYTLFPDFFDHLEFTPNMSGWRNVCVMMRGDIRRGI